MNIVDADVTLTGVVVGFDEDKLNVLKEGQEIFSGRCDSAIFRVAPCRLYMKKSVRIIKQCSKYGGNVFKLFQTSTRGITASV